MNECENNLFYFWKGDMVKLRPLKIADSQAIFDEQTDSEADRAFNACIHPIKPLEEIREWVENKGKEDKYMFAIENMNGDFVGTANIHSRNEQAGTFSFTIRVFRPYRRNGYAKDAFRILLRHGFYELRYQKANSVTIDLNEASIKLHTSLGFKIEGRIRRNTYTGGKYHDEIFFGMTREEFDELEMKYINTEV